MNHLPKYLRDAAKGLRAPAVPGLLEDARTVSELLEDAADEIERLQRVQSAAKLALGSCRTSMHTLVNDGIHAQSTNSTAEQFAAAWRDLKDAVAAAEKGD